MFEILLWVAIGMLAYIYVGYPILAIVLGHVFRRPVVHGNDIPSITVIISAYNEEKHIGEKIRNTLGLDYHPDKLDIIVASDASSDATDQIVLKYAARNVRLMRIEGRLGKTACQNAAAAAASGEILLFADATTMVERGALKAIVRNFGDPTVGCVAGRLVYTSHLTDATGNGGTSYWEYESTLRMAESNLGSLVGVSGQLYAVRASAYRPISPDMISDFVIAMDIREQGLRTVLEPEAICVEETLDRADQELSMRIRVALRSLTALATQRHLMNPLRFGLFSWQLLSHKMLRYLSPLFLLLALAANIALVLQGQYELLLALQLSALAIGMIGFLPGRLLGGSRVLAQPYYFVLTNVASAVSLFRFIRGKRVVTWTPVR